MHTAIISLQLNSTDNIQNNLTKVSSLLKQASTMEDVQQAQHRLVLLPENFAFIGKDESAKLLISENYGQGLIQNYLTKLAKEYNLWIIAGTMPIKLPYYHVNNEKKIYAASLVFNPQGNIVAHYNKMHLFDVNIPHDKQYLDSNTIEGGFNPVCVETPFARIGLAVCYDLRFPELSRLYTKLGTNILVFPSAFTYITGEAHWQILLRARAIENQSYVIAANQCGKHVNNNESYGHSMIIDPWGKVIAQLTNENNGIIVAKFSMEKLQHIRRNLPVATSSKL